MIDAIRLVHGYVEGTSREEFFADRKTQQAVILNILVLGEAATQLGNAYPEWAEQHSEVPWRSMRGMRNRLAHGYFEINLEVVWDTIKMSLPELEEKLAKVLHETPYREDL
ncbi:HepT-like ribonuclease domain-containing protein [Candidatus Accumulibacter aalborgensis]|nr:DUF86 domain-containing protein [Candidatus Accumulibacter aalborgensis]